MSGALYSFATWEDRREHEAMADPCEPLAWNEVAAAVERALDETSREGEPAEAEIQAIAAILDRLPAT